MAEPLLTTVPRKNANVVFRKIAGECILVPLARSVADVHSIFSLNETGAAVWEKIDSRKSLAQIVAEMHAEFEAEIPALERDVAAFVAEMAAAHLLEA